MEQLIGFERGQLAQVNRGISSIPVPRIAAKRGSAGFNASRSCEMELAETPEVRAAAVARGKSLIADPDYPSPKQMRAIAHLLARRF